MISVLDHIEYLMTEHDCVIVPGLGAFISQYSVARNSSTGVIDSIKRNIAFNSSVDYNDGLLINSIMRRENISYDRAKNEVSDYVCALYGQLKHEGEVPVGRLGYFSNGNGDLLEFFPFMSKKAHNEFFGLLPIGLKPLSEALVEEDVAERKPNNVVIIAHRCMQVAASIMLLVGLALVLSTPIVDKSNQNYANLNAFEVKSGSIEPLVQDLYIAMPIVKEQSETIPQSEETVSAISQTGKYCLVVASLISEKQVEKFIKESNLENFEVFKVKSKYRVYVARGSYEEMCKLKSTEYSDSDAWVCRI